MKADQLRQEYLDFFKTKGHIVIPSSPLVPENDPTTLFTSSGMQPLVEYLLGAVHPSGNRLVDSQRCFRSQDIEEVGDNRHTTFFEMLGNWSLGDYFKEEQLSWVFEFLTQTLHLDPKHLFVTVFAGNAEVGKDEESIRIWKSLFKTAGIDATVQENAQSEGMGDGRIFSYGEKKNWWSRSGTPDQMPVFEPGGPDSEIFYDFGKDRKLHEHSQFRAQPCHVNCDCGRFMEIGNSVFMQFQKLEDGSFHELAQKNVDFGGGLVRMLAATNNDPDVFKTDLFLPLIHFIEQTSKRSYDQDEKTIQSMRVIADHMKAAVMLASDGVFPSNKGQGYFSRRLIRRSLRYAKMIGITEPFLAEIVTHVISIYKHAYPHLELHQEAIVEAMSQEEGKFLKTIDKGLKEIEKYPQLDGSIAFSLYETYGFPLELTQEIALERGQVVDRALFEKEFEAHKSSSRSSSIGMFKGGLADHSETTTKYHTATHLLHAALRKILGTHVQQKGSNITTSRLRFDFSHPNALTSKEKQLVEDQVNEWIQQDYSVFVEKMKKSDAIQSGAIAFFIEKYPDEVTVYTIAHANDQSWISKELCGGPHVQHTGSIGTIKIVKEQAVASGIRRIYLELV